jgi:hypothetical protein
MHPVTRLGRVIQQLRSFGDLHAGELELLAADLPEDMANRVRIYRDVQRSEASMVVEELLDIQAAMAESAPPPAPELTGDDPAVNSPRRAKWLAEQAAEAARLKQPISRRDFFAHGPAKGEEGEV